MKKVEVLQRLLEQNQATAEDIRRRLAHHQVLLCNILGSPGSGKTTLLEMTLPHLTGDLRCAVLEGDLATTRDAERIARLDVPTIQLLTDGGCHLEAGLLDRALQDLDLAALDCVFVENVGNLVCPANFDLGEHLRVVVLSVAEGDDKPLKYPLMFQRCHAVVISKCDLLPACRFDVAGAKAHVRGINPQVTLFEVEATRQDGLQAWVQWLRQAMPGAAERRGAEGGP